MSNWQPIETAPKDGTRVMLAIFRGDERWKALWGGEEYELYHLASYNGYNWDPYIPNGWTHWMPLPEPPNE